ncbi:MAG: cytochrome c [Candidatus Contendobacter sp.]|nr:MAG: cytochrome c [Candidatus Contendobacter sp.]
MIRSTSWYFVVAGICSVLAGIVRAGGDPPTGDPAAGKNKFATCAGCHAIPGYTNAYPNYHVPRLGGQHPDYIVAALKAYQAGDRSHPTMHANAFSLSEQDIRDIAAYVAGFTSTAPAQPVQGDAVAGKTKSTVCAACHGPDGNSSITLYPRLAGQYEDYLRKALQDYQAGKRNNPIMKGMVATLSEQDMADLAAFFASQVNGLGIAQQP